jgi:hypothetical protein
VLDTTDRDEFKAQCLKLLSEVKQAEKSYNIKAKDMLGGKL